MSDALRTGDLRVWWVPQIPMKSFYISVESYREAKKLLTVLAAYDFFQFENKVKPDYCNAGGLEIFLTERMDEDGDGWEDFFTIDGEEFDDLSKEQIDALDEKRKNGERTWGG